MKIGFIGTRQGITPAQETAISGVIEKLHRKFGPIRQAHHGCCKGADEDFCGIVEIRFAGVVIIGHPAFREGHAMRGDCHCQIVLPVKEIWTRNREIVNQADVLIAASLENHPMPVGGTWGTVKIASDANKPICVVWPDGRLGWRNTEKIKENQNGLLSEDISG